MNEQEKANIKKRGLEYGTLGDDPDLDYIRSHCYVQGALDQDPISRKSERDRIIHAIKYEGILTPWHTHSIIKFLETL
jgi:hypothetical protein